MYLAVLAMCCVLVSCVRTLCRFNVIGILKNLGNF